MTTFLGRIAKVVKDLRELNVIQERDKIEYHSFDVYQITITTDVTDDKEMTDTAIRYGTIHKSFLDEFVPEEIAEQNCEYTKVEFVFRKSQVTNEEGA